MPQKRSSFPLSHLYREIIPIIGLIQFSKLIWLIAAMVAAATQTPVV